MSALAVQDDRYARAQLIKLEIDRLALEAQRSDITHDEIVLVRQEMEILLESLREIRREQLREQIAPPAADQRAPWWRRWFR